MKFKELKCQENAQSAEKAQCQETMFLTHTTKQEEDFYQILELSESHKKTAQQKKSESQQKSLEL